MATNRGDVVSEQKFDPWGKVRSGGVTQASLNYTGQRLDSTGLLYYHARMYDPVLGRFISPDSIVPGASSGVGGAGGTVGAEQNSKLTVDFHETGFVSSLNAENSMTLQKGFRFQLSDRDRQYAEDPSGPGDPQALNRYSYVLNNPIRYVDPSGHWVSKRIPRGNNGIDEIMVLSKNEVNQIAQKLTEIAAWTGGAALLSFLVAFLTVELELPAVLALALGRLLLTISTTAGGLATFLAWLTATGGTIAIECVGGQDGCSDAKFSIAVPVWQYLIDAGRWGIDIGTIPDGPPTPGGSGGADQLERVQPILESGGAAQLEFVLPRPRP
jgi:RHS repeat-associated protein